eukprot:gi/632942745/ref/XP_007886576.1/ PREDICTED: kinesin-like protein KIF28P [Callorhinchus milii]
MLNADSIKVAVRVCPFNQREKAVRSKCIISMLGNSMTIVDPKSFSNKKTFLFDYCYWSTDEYMENDQGVYMPDGPNSRYVGQERVFSDLGRALLENAWKGYNATLFSYGQTGSGKSYSMTGYGGNKGLVPMICEELFQGIKLHQNEDKQFHVYFSIFEIYNEQIQDLLSKVRKPSGLRMREGRHGFYVECLKSVPCTSYKQLEAFLEQGIRNRSTASTNRNTSSSRSHMVITIRFQQVFADQPIMKHSEINLVDLAGSERQRSVGVTSDRFNEARAINLSLTTLGNVISALSDKVVGRKVQYIPYRNSVLTRLLSTALGGNSKTVMIATISPADINYDETMSTLRFAERAKSIQNRAMINESLTEQLLRDLNDDNTRLQKMMVEFPYLLNVNEDPQLSGVVRHFIQNGICTIGKTSVVKQDIVLKGLGILDKHAVLTVSDQKVGIEPQSKARVIINGLLLLTKYQLRHLDRVILGSSSFYLYVGFPNERRNRDKIHKYNYEYFASELASNEGLRQVNPVAAGKQKENLDPNLTRIVHDFISIMPSVTWANQISEELNKGVIFEPEVKNLALTDARGEELEKEIIVKVTNKLTKQVEVWLLNKFTDRMPLIEETYQHFLENGDTQTDLEEDVFWDPVEPLHLGSAHVWLESLAYSMTYEDQVDINNYQGKEEALIQIKLMPCTTSGNPLGDESVVVDPDNLLGKRMDFQMQISLCLGVRWIRENSSRGVQIGFVLYGLPTVFYTPAAWSNTNPDLDYSIHFTVQHVTTDFLSYLKTHALVLQMWGLQEGCQEMDTILDGIPLSSDGSVLLDLCYRNQQTSVPLDYEEHRLELSEQIETLEQEAANLTEANRILKSDNFEMREKAGELRRLASDNGSSIACGNAAKLTDDRSNQRSPFPNWDAEFAKALKAFYFSMSGARGRLIHLNEIRPLDEGNIHSLRYFANERTELIKEMGGELETCVGKLKNDVAKIIRKKKELQIDSTVKN